MKNFILFSLGYLFCLALIASSSFKAFVDKNTVYEGEAIRLSLEFNGSTRKSPNLMPLYEDFEILSQSKRQQTTVNNGKTESKTIWTYDIFPRKDDKKITIPSIKFEDYQSDPIEINIANFNNNYKKQDENLKILATTDVTQAYVNSQILLNITVTASSKITRGQFSDLKLENSIIEPLEKPKLEEKVENGLLQQKITARYAIFPTKTGVLTIPPITFEGRQAKGTRRFPGSFGFFDDVKRIRVRTKKITINIKPIPDSFPKGKPFLPAKSLAITESFDEAEPKFVLGKPIARRFDIIAQGVLPSLLPSIKEPYIKNLNIYTESGEKKQEITEDGILSEGEVSHVYIPMAGGNFTVPEQIIYWWDTLSDELKTAKIRKLTFKAEGAAFVEPKKTAPEEPTKVLMEKPKRDHNLFMLIALVLILFFGIVYFLIKINKKIKSRHKKSDFAILKDLCKKSDAKEVYKYLVNLNNSNFDDLKEKLGTVLYGNAEKEEIKEIINSIILRVNNNLSDKKNEDILKPLYPN